ncbi:universal stress protein [Embleya sp. MST-111070]|uniref:universal stress protein n=1 Tax=Embleya sp. MST-111070 TaxID=3398231 RepID=UPI003F73E979
MNDNISAGATTDATDGTLRGHVVVGVDGSPISDLATDRAADEAALRHTPLEVLHVVEGDPNHEEGAHAARLRTDAEALVGRAADRARRRQPDLAIVTTIVLGRTVPTLEEAAERARLIVLGNRGRGGFAGLLMGSVSLSVAATSRCPILVVHARHPNAPENEPGSIVVGISDFDCSPAVEAAFAAAQARALPLRAVHAWTPPLSPAAPYAPPLWSGDDGRNAADATLGAALAPFLDKYPDVSLTEQVVCDVPAHALLATTDEADLIVLAAHRRHGRFGPNLGHVTHVLLHHSKVPVLLIPVD